MNAEFGGNDSGEGCYLGDVSGVFDRRNGGERNSGSLDYLRFIGAHIAKGEIRLYGTSPVRTPIALRAMTGKCADTEGAEAVNDNYGVLREGFGKYIRARGVSETCGDPDRIVGLREGLKIQGHDFDSAEDADPPINAWLSFEFDLIAMAAGWHEGMTGTQRGEPRPPLCHY